MSHPPQNEKEGKKHKSEYTKSDPLLPVINPKIGAKYHLSWAKKHGMVWVLTAIDGDIAIMRTPKTKRVLRTKLSDLRHMRRTQLKIENGLTFSQKGLDNLTAK